MSLEDDPDYKKIKLESHKAFILNMMKGNSATESYSLAFPDAKRTTAGVKGSKLKRKYGDIIERNAPINMDRIERVANQTLHNLTLMAFADAGEIVDRDGNPKPLHSLSKGMRMAVTEIEVRGKKITYKMDGRVKSLELLAKICKIDNPQPAVEINLISEEDRRNRIKEILTVAANRNVTNDEDKE